MERGPKPNPIPSSAPSVPQVLLHIVIITIISSSRRGSRGGKSKGGAEINCVFCCHIVLHSKLEQAEASRVSRRVSRVFGAKCNPLEGIYISAADTDGIGITCPSSCSSCCPPPLLNVAAKCINQFHVFLSERARARPARFECLHLLPASSSFSSCLHQFFRVWGRFTYEWNNQFRGS